MSLKNDIIHNITFNYSIAINAAKIGNRTLIISFRKKGRQFEISERYESLCSESSKGMGNLGTN